MIQERDDIVALDSAIIQHPRTWEASGHLAGFTDPLVQCLGKCKQRFREDHLREEPSPRREPSKLPGVRRRADRAARVQPDVRDDDRPGAGGGRDGLPAPRDRAGHLPRLQDDAQYARRKPPFGIAQVGKSFRNEITPGNFIFRTLEFEQMEMEFFVPPDEAEQWYELLAPGAAGLVRRARHRPRAPAAARPRRRRALALLVRHRRRRVPVPDRLVGARGHRQPRRLRPHAARAVLAARSSSTSTRRPASATCRT